MDWYCTINEPGVVAFGGYVGALGFPPGEKTLASWDSAIDGLSRGLVQSFGSVKEARPEAQVGSTHAMIEYESNDAGRPMTEFFRSRMEDRFFAACDDEDFVGVQTYTRQEIAPPAWSAPAVRALIDIGPVRRFVMPRLIRRLTRLGDAANSKMRTTDMGYEYRPEAVAATVRRAHEVFPGKSIIVTEHGIATTDDTERIDFIRHGLAGLHSLIDEGIPLRGYIHWSAFDNFEWALGYRMQFGLIAVDRSTQTRDPKPSAHFLGNIARSNSVEMG